MSDDEQKKAAPEQPVPSLDSLAQQLPAEGEAAGDADPSSDEESRPTTEYRALGSAAAPAQPASEVDERAATDLHPAAKPKPKAIPLAEVGRDDLEADQPPPSGLLRAVLGLGAAVLLAGGVVALGLWGPGQEPTVPQVVSVPIEAPQVDPALARRIIQPIATTGAKRPSLTAEAAAAPASETDGPVRVPYERRDGRIVLPVSVRGPVGDKLVQLALDGDTTYPTLTTATLDEIGVTPTAVRAKVSLKGRVARRTLAIVEAIAARTATVAGGLTVAVCDGCAEDEIEGLLGSSFSRHFALRVDETASEVVLRPRQLTDKTIDVQPFLELRLRRRNQRGHRLALRFRLRNKAPRALTRLVVQAAAPGIDKPTVASIPFLAAGAQREATLVASLPARVAKDLTLRVVSGGF